MRDVEDVSSPSRSASLAASAGPQPVVAIVVVTVPSGVTVSPEVMAQPANAKDATASTRRAATDPHFITSLTLLYAYVSGPVPLALGEAIKPAFQPRKYDLNVARKADQRTQWRR
jgi:hypothetical protein